MQVSTRQNPPVLVQPGNVQPGSVQPGSVPVRRPWNTLELLKGGLYLLWALEALFLTITASGIWEHRASMKTIGKDTVPSIIAAQKIRSSLAGMDASVANELLGGLAASDQLKVYEAGRESTANAIIDAAENITYGNKEKEPIQKLQLNLGKYEELVQRARDLHARKDPSASLVYLESAELMDNELLKAADALDQANKDELDRAYNGAGKASLATRSGIAIIGLVLLLALLRVQVFLNQRMRRVFNPSLVAATILAAVFLLHTLSVLSRESHELKIAKEDAFTSIDTLWRARSVAYAANADLARDLLDDQHGGIHQTAFAEKSNQLARADDGKLVSDLVKSTLLHNKTAGYSGYLVNELNNVTFPGEQEAASKTLLAFAGYNDLVRNVLARRTGKRDESIARWTGGQQAQVHTAFQQFDQALDQTLRINALSFRDSVDRGSAALAGFEIKIAIFGLLFAALIYIGLLPRIREYT